MAQKNFIISKRAAGLEVDPINLDYILSFKKFYDPSYNAKSKKAYKHQILFIRGFEAAKQEVLVWRYEDECARDKDFDELLSLYSTELSSNQ